MHKRIKTTHDFQQYRLSPESNLWWRILRRLYTLKTMMRSLLTSQKPVLAFHKGAIAIIADGVSSSAYAREASQTSVSLFAERLLRYAQQLVSEGVGVESSDVP